MSTAKIDTWIKAGYELLATEGVEGIKVERLARILALNKSGFYYYFGTMDVLIKKLLQHHIHLAKTVAGELATCGNIDPDLLLLIVKYRTFFLVESQLLVKGRSILQYADVDEAGRIVNDELLRLWGKTRELPEDTSVSLAYLNIIRHFFYARISPENMNYGFLHSLAAETQDVLGKVMMDKHVSSSN